MRKRVLRRAPALLALALALGCASDPADEQFAWPAASAGCVACHATEAAEQRVARAHRSDPAGCLLCHAPHSGANAGEGPAGLRARCADCHGAERAQFALPFRHPLGVALDCTSCHAPHGLAPREQREELRHDVCVRCHREYQGPFLFEHEGDRTRQCLACHEAHGSANQRMLTHADTRLLCMSCHGFLPEEHFQNPGSIYRECLHCHTEVHGSQWNRDFLR